MPKRSDWLTDTARPIAEELAARCGSLKKVMSAGIMSLAELHPEEREYYMAKAEGLDVKISDDFFRHRVLQILKEAKETPSKKKVSQQAKTSKSG